MHILKRVSYYIGGFAVGLVLLAFFLKGSGTEIPSCDYMPNARVLKTIRNKGYKITPELQQLMAQTSIDTLQLNRLFLEGNVDFDKSQQHLKPCGMYFITSSKNETNPINASVSICEEADYVTVESIAVKR
ncbi:hypothetical protein [Flavimarina sp. Hel_I_48]|uniref:hypothetical protein n=1 Tax=Flavimarina sp. Hel_I_48 TaxID=1392488 RepID=UPI0004DFB812|nr:hypothetical protein [Flavimarina sp. Hel_I_48]